MASISEMVDFNSAVEKLKSKVAEFLRVRDFLLSLGDSVPPEKSAEYNSLMEKSRFVAARIREIENTIDAVRFQYDQYFGNDNSPASVVNGLNGGQTLGFIPFVVGGVVIAVAAATAYITGWITDAYKFSKGLEAAREGVIDERTFASIFTDAPLISGGSSILPIAVVGGLLLYILNKR